MLDQYIDLNKLSDEELEQLKGELEERQKGLGEEFYSIIRFSGRVDKELGQRKDKNS